MTESQDDRLKEKDIELFGIKISPIQRMIVFVISLMGLIIPPIIIVGSVTVLINVLLVSSSYTFFELILRIFGGIISIGLMIGLFILSAYVFNQIKIVKY
jgi:hypothetical protein